MTSTDQADPDVHRGRTAGVARSLPGPVACLRDLARAHRRGVSMGARLAALGLVLWLFVLPQVHGASHWWRLLLDIRSSWVPVAVVAEIGSLALYTLATRTLLAPRTRPPYDRVARIDLSAIALGHCLPDGGAAGTALCWRLLVAEGVPSLDAAVTKVAQGLGSAVVLELLVLGGLLGGAVGHGLSRWALAPILIAAAVLVGTAVIAAGLSHLTLRDRVHGALARIPRFGPRIASAVDGVYRRDVVEHLRAVATDPRKFAAAAAFSGGNWALDALALWACLHAYGPGVGLQGLAVVYAIQTVGSWIPVTPSGLGLSESLMIPALVAFGTPGGDAVLGIITWRLLAYWLPIPLGAAAYATLGRSAAADRR